MIQQPVLLQVIWQILVTVPSWSELTITVPKSDLVLNGLQCRTDQGVCAFSTLENDIQVAISAQTLRSPLTITQGLSNP